MRHLNHTAFVNVCRDERGVGHHTLRAYAQDLRTFARFAAAHQLSDPLSKDDILAYHQHLRDVIEAKPATIERRLSTLKSYLAWREDRNSTLPSPFGDLRTQSVSRDAAATGGPGDATESAAGRDANDHAFVGVSADRSRPSGDGRCHDPDHQTAHREWSPHQRAHQLEDPRRFSQRVSDSREWQG